MKTPEGCEWPEPEQTDLFIDVIGKSEIKPKIEGIPIEHISDIKTLQTLVTNLWALLDDIDTIEDIAKSDNKLYRSLTESIHVKRYKTGITSDGYNLFYEK